MRITFFALILTLISSCVSTDVERKAVAKRMQSVESNGSLNLDSLAVVVKGNKMKLDLLQEKIDYYVKTKPIKTDIEVFKVPKYQFTLDSLTSDLSFGNGCDSKQVTLSLNEGFDFNGYKLELNNVKLFIFGNTQSNGLTLNSLELITQGNLIMNCLNDEIIEL